jgi:hypothetical protein
MIYDVFLSDCQGINLSYTIQNIQRMKRVTIQKKICLKESKMPNSGAPDLRFVASNQLGL